MKEKGKPVTDRKSKIKLTNRLQFKIISSNAIVIIVFIAILLMLGFRFTGQLVQTHIFNNYRIISKSMSETVIAKLNYFIGGVSTISENTNLIEIKDKPDFKPYTVDTLRSLQISDPHFMLVYMCTETAKNYFFPEIQTDADPRERPWYIQAKTHPGVQYTKPYDDLFTGSKVISVMKAVYKEGSFVGVVGADINMSFIQEYLASSKFSETSVSYLLSATNGVILIHENPDIHDTSPDAAVINSVKNSKDNLNVITDANGKKKIVLHNFIESLDSYLVTEIDYRDLQMISDGVSGTILLFGIVSGLILISLSVILSSIVMKSIKQVTVVAEKIADGDLNVDLTIRSKDELGVLSEAFRKTIERLTNYRGYINDISEALVAAAKGDLCYNTKMIYVGQFEKLKENILMLQNNLSDIIVKISETSDNVNLSSSKVSAAAASLSSGASSQAGTIEELSASISQITEQIKQNSLSSTTAMQKAELANLKLNESTEHMNNMITAMDEITQKSSEINKIVKMIDDIAFQTNILALNAAVEAARAGNAGKGFAVVADEVRNLAARSAEAVRTTTGLIEETVAAVDNGTRIASLTQGTLMETKEVTEETMSLIHNISDASKEQSNSMEEISQAVEHTSSIVQSNASTAQESANTSSELYSQAEMLRQLVNQFKLKH